MDTNRVVVAIRPDGTRLSSAVHPITGEATHERSVSDLIRLHVLARNAEDFIRRVDQE
jgi:hypothetical protein